MIYREIGRFDNARRSPLPKIDLSNFFQISNFVVRMYLPRSSRHARVYKILPLNDENGIKKMIKKNSCVK